MPFFRYCALAPKDVVEFESNPRCAFPAVVGKQPALVFVPYEAKDESTDASDNAAEHENTKGRDNAQSVLLYIVSQQKMTIRSCSRETVSR